MTDEPVGLAAPNEDVVRRAMTDRATYIRLAREGLTGSMGYYISQLVGRDVTTSVLSTSSKNLARYFRNARLPMADSESLLDALRTTFAAEVAWGDREPAKQWLHEAVPALGNEAPINLMDTFEGRSWIREALRKIATTDFS